MCQFVETLRIDNGRACRLDLHDERMNRTRRAFWGSVPDLNIVDYLPAVSETGVFKCRVLYGKRIESVTVSAYSVRPVHTLQAVYTEEADYSYKWADRTVLNKLFDRRNGADDVLIVRNGLLTDTSITNVALYDGNAWFTPASPLLAGTQRAELLRRGVLHERDIALDGMYGYSEIMLFNAMIEFGRLRIPIDREHVWL